MSLALPAHVCCLVAEQRNKQCLLQQVCTCPKNVVNFSAVQAIPIATGTGKQNLTRDLTTAFQVPPSELYGRQPLTDDWLPNDGDPLVLPIMQCLLKV
jgi:hypothetical protein